MGKVIDRKIKMYVKDLLEGSGAKDKDIAKLAILANKYYEDNKNAFEAFNAPFLLRKNIMSTFILFMVQFETVCIKAYKISGSGNTSDDIINLYSSINRTNVKGEKLLIKSN